MENEAETITGGGRRGNPPTRTFRIRRTARALHQQQQGARGGAGREVEPPARLEIERTLKKAPDCARRLRLEGLLDGPQTFGVGAGLNHDKAGGIEAQVLQAMAMRIGGGKSSRRSDQEDRRFQWQAGEDRSQKSKGGGEVGVALIMESMKARPRQAAAGDVIIDSGDAEGEEIVGPLPLNDLGDRAAQGREECGAAGGGRRHGRRHGRSLERKGNKDNKGIPGRIVREFRA